MLGAIFINNEAFAPVDALVNTEDFFEPINQEIFRICGRANSARVSSSAPSQSNHFCQLILRSETSLFRNIARLAAEATTVINAPDYAKVVRDMANRHLIAAAEHCAIAAKTAAVDVPAEQIAADTIKCINEITPGCGATGSNQASPHIRPLAAAEFLRLDLPPRQQILAPWLPDKGLVMVYSPRGVGKTLLGMSSAYAIAVGAGFLGFSIGASVARFYTSMARCRRRRCRSGWRRSSGLRGNRRRRLSFGF